MVKFYTVSELRANASEIVSQILSTGEEVVVTKKGKPVILMRPISEKEFELKGDKKHGKG